MGINRVDYYINLYYKTIKFKTMGLDMYLNKHTYVKHWEHNGDNNYEVKVTKAGNPTNMTLKRLSISLRKQVIGVKLIRFTIGS